MVRAAAEASRVHRGDHGLGAVQALGLALREMVKVRELGGDEQHRRTVRAGGHAGAAADARGGIHRAIRRLLGDEDIVGVGGGAAVGADEAAGGDHAIERRAIDAEVLDHGERVGAPRLDPDLVVVLEEPHVQLARGGGALTAVRATVDHQRAAAADAFAAVVIERDRLFARRDELLVEDVEHLEEGGVGGHVLDLVGDELAGGLLVHLTPDVEGEVQVAHL